MNFSDALRQLQAGRKVRLNYWAKGVFLELRDNNDWINEPTIFMRRDKTNGKTHMTLNERWDPSQTDILSTAWEKA